MKTNAERNAEREFKLRTVKLPVTKRNQIFVPKTVYTRKIDGTSGLPEKDYDPVEEYERGMKNEN